MRTIGSELAANRGLGPGFDFLRVFLAFSVIAVHVPAVVLGSKGLQDTPFVWIADYAVLSAFFGLSGFLISGSATRLRLRDFLLNRGLRIVPALAVEIILGAFVLGSIFTSLPLRDYLTRGTTWHYLTNIFGWVNYYIPSVFENHPVSMVNYSIWTVPHEIGCYAIMSLLIVFGLLKKPPLVLVAAILVGVIGIVAQAYGLTPDMPNQNIGEKVISHFFVWHWSRLYVGFLFGIATYLYRDRIPFDGRLAAVAAIWLVLVDIVGPSPLLSVPVLNLVAAPAIIYLIAYVGLSPIPKLPLFHRGDYSYGIYLYGWPAQQTIVALLPGQKSLLLNFVLVVPLIMVFAMVSWHGVEKPILRARKKFSFVARQRLAEEDRPNPPPPFAQPAEPVENPSAA